MLNSDNDHNMDDIQIYVDLAKAVEANETAVANGETVDKNTTRIEVLKTGTWKTAKGNFSLTASDLQQMAQNYASDVRPHSSSHGLPIDEEHSKKAALGWLKEPSVEANDRGGHTLFMNAHWTNDGLSKVKDGTYKFFSPEVHFQHDDPEGTLPKLRNVLMGGGVTNRPLFKGLAGIPALTASDGTADEDNKIYVNNEKESKVDLETIRKKANKDVTTEERKILDGAKDQLTEAERKNFYPEATEPVAPVAPVVEKPAPAAVAASESTVVTLTASELETLQANAAAGLEASEQLKRNVAESEVTEMFFSEADGLKLPTDMKAGVTDLWIDASEAEKETLRNIAKNSKPMLSASDRVQTGSNQDGAGTAQDLLNDKVTDLMASEAGKKLGYSAALKQARRENPDIAKEADHEIAAETPQLAAR